MVTSPATFFFFTSKLISHYSSNIVAEFSFLEAKRPQATLHNRVTGILAHLYVIITF